MCGELALLPCVLCLSQLASSFVFVTGETIMECPIVVKNSAAAIVGFCWLARASSLQEA